MYTTNMNQFSERFTELLNDTETKTLMAHMGFNTPSPIYKWKNGKKGLLLNTAVKLADYFQCSLDYLFGRTDLDTPICKAKECPPFDVQFRKVLTEQKVSQYVLLKNEVVFRGNLNNWLNQKRIPHIESIIRIANYLDVSMDYLVGRE